MASAEDTIIYDFRLGAHADQFVPVVARLQRQSNEDLLSDSLSRGIDLALETGVIMQLPSIATDGELYRVSADLVVAQNINRIADYNDVSPERMAPLLAYRGLFEYYLNRNRIDRKLNEATQIVWKGIARREEGVIEDPDEALRQWSNPGVVPPELGDL